MTKKYLGQGETKNQNGFQSLIPVFLLLIVFLIASRTPLDSDLWWHLRSGQVMAETGKPLLVDLFSFTRGGEVWINHSWLGEVLIYQIYRLTGWTGLSAWMGVTAMMIAVVIWHISPGGLFTRAGLVLLASMACSPLWTPRPQFFSLLLLAVLILFMRGRFDRGGPSIWLIPLFFILWSNLHGGYMMGILYLLVFTLGLFFDAIGSLEETRKIELQQSGRLLLISIASFLLTAVNPNGWKMWTIPFETVGVNLLRQFIQEWASPDFHAVEVWPFAAWMLIILFSLGRSKVRVDYRHLFPALFFFLLALYARRNIAGAVLASTGILSISWENAWEEMRIHTLLPDWMNRVLDWYQKHRGKELAESHKRILNLTLAGLMGLFCFSKLAAVTHPILMEAFESRYYPKKALEFIQANPQEEGNHIFNAYNWGGYLAWKAPNIPVFVDGRTDLFGDDILGQWVSVMQANEEWEEILGKWDVDRIFIEPDRPLVKAAELAGWTEIYRDDQAVVLDKTGR